MKNLDLINESIQKMANMPSEKAISAAQCIAKEMDDALANGYEIEWRCLPIQNSETVDIVNVSNKPSFVCRIYSKDIWDEVLEIFDGVDLTKDEKGKSSKILNLVFSWPK